MVCIRRVDVSSVSPSSELKTSAFLSSYTADLTLITSVDIKLLCLISPATWSRFLNSVSSMCYVNWFSTFFARLPHRLWFVPPPKNQHFNCSDLCCVPSKEKTCVSRSNKFETSLTSYVVETSQSFLELCLLSVRFKLREKLLERSQTITSVFSNCLLHL